MAQFSRVKVWVSNEVLTANDLNGEFNNILNNFAPAGMDSASSNVSNMQATTDPGAVGTESLASSLLGELQRLRYTIKRIVGGAQWYVDPGRNLSAGGLAVQTADIATGAITSAKILDGTIVQGDMANASIGTAQLIDGSVTTAKLANTSTNVVGNYNYVAGNINTTITSVGDVVNAAQTVVSTAGWKIWTQFSGTTTNVTAAVQAGTLTTIFDTVNNDGILIQSSQLFDRLAFTVSTATTGSPSFSYQYWNGTTWASLGMRTTPNFAATGSQIAWFFPPNDWVVGSDDPAVDSTKWSMRIHTPTAPSTGCAITGLTVATLAGYSCGPITLGGNRPVLFAFTGIFQLTATGTSTSFDATSLKSPSMNFIIYRSTTPTFTSPIPVGTASYGYTEHVYNAAVISHQVPATILNFTSSAQNGLSGQIPAGTYYFKVSVTMGGSGTPTLIATSNALETPMFVQEL